MKLLLTSVLAAALGLNWLGPRSAAPDVSTCAPGVQACDARVEPLGDGTCRIECDGPAGPAWAIVACEGPDDCRVLAQGGADCNFDTSTPECEPSPLFASASTTVLAAAPLALPAPLLVTAELAAPAPLAAQPAECAPVPCEPQECEPAPCDPTACKPVACAPSACAPSAP